MPYTATTLGRSFGSNRKNRGTGRAACYGVAREWPNSGMPLTRMTPQWYTLTRMAPQWYVPHDNDPSVVRPHENGPSVLRPSREWPLSGTSLTRIAPSVVSPPRQWPLSGTPLTKMASQWYAPHCSKGRYIGAYEHRSEFCNLLTRTMVRSPYETHCCAFFYTCRLVNQCASRSVEKHFGS